MRRSRSVLTALVMILLAGAEASAQTKETYLQFKDNFIVRGKITQPKTFITDPSSGQSFTIPVPGGFYSVDDGVRNIIFSPAQVYDAIKEQVAPEYITITKTVPGYTGIPLPRSWEMMDPPRFEDNWERVLTLQTPAGTMGIPQRIAFLSPKKIGVEALKRDWASFFSPDEEGFGPTEIRRLLFAHYLKQPKISPEERRLLIYRFFLQAGWMDAAEDELTRILRDYPASRAKNEEIMRALQEVRAVQWVEATERLPKVGQHREVMDRLKQFQIKQKGPDKIDDQKIILKMLDLKLKYESLAENLKEAQRLLEAMPLQVTQSRQAFFKEAAAAIALELNIDTLPRLETFISQGQERERNIKNQKAAEPRAEEVMALAISGWLLGNGAAEKNIETAYQLWQARTFIQTYLKTNNARSREQLASAWKGLSVDEVARLLPMLPPPDAHDKLDTSVQAFAVEAPEAKASGSYHVKLPPEYHHGKSWPVLIVLHNSKENTKTTLVRWQDLAAEHGYILMAPAWADGGKGQYQYSPKEHQVFLDAFRDFKRRFNADSDRVFLFGQEEGGRAAFDIGISHPDLFAGVLPMSAMPQYYVFRYWPNAQLLPFYVTLGDTFPAMAKDTRTLFRDWVRWNYPALLVEYKGRPSDWFTAEPERMIKWMNCKKRAHPMRQLGRGRDEEYMTMRLSDNRFYWLSVDSISVRVLNDPRRWNPQLVAGKLEASISAGNHIRVKASGVGRVTVWLGPGMLNYGEKASFHVNGSVVYLAHQVTPSLEVLLEDQYSRADRQRVYFARLDAKL